MSYTRRRFFFAGILAGMPIALISPADVCAQGMSQMPGMAETKQEVTASATGTVTAIDGAGRKITFNHGPIPEIKWPAMKVEFPIVPSVDLSKVK